MSSTTAETPTRTYGRRLGRALAYGVAVAVVLFGVGFLVRSKWGPLQTLDDELIAAATSFARPRDRLRSFLVAWQWLTQPIRLYAIGTALCLWVWLAKGLRTRAWWAFGTMMVAWFIGLAWTAVHVAGPAGAGLVMGVGSVPRAAILLVGGAYADRLDVPARCSVLLLRGQPTGRQCAARRLVR